MQWKYLYLYMASWLNYGYDATMYAMNWLHNINTKPFNRTSVPFFMAIYGSIPKVYLRYFKESQFQTFNVQIMCGAYTTEMHGLDIRWNVRSSYVSNCNELKHGEDHLLSCLPNCGPLERWTMIGLLFFLLLIYLCVTLNCIITMWAMSQICMYRLYTYSERHTHIFKTDREFFTFIFHFLIFIWNLHNRRIYSFSM